MKANRSIRSSKSSPKKFRCSLPGAAANTDLEWPEENSRMRPKSGRMRVEHLVSGDRIAPEGRVALSTPASAHVCFGSTFFTGHALVRSAQRGLGLASVEAAVFFGREWRQRGGFTVHYLGERQVAAAAHCGADLREFLGVTVILSPDHRVITLYRSRSAPQRLGRLG